MLYICCACALSESIVQQSDDTIQLWSMDGGGNAFSALFQFSTSQRAPYAPLKQGAQIYGQYLMLDSCCGIVNRFVTTSDKQCIHVYQTLVHFHFGSNNSTSFLVLSRTCYLISGELRRRCIFPLPLPLSPFPTDSF